MQTKITIHECFSCHYFNHYFNVPYYVKGKKCKRCHKYNYFNINTRYIRKKNQNNNGRMNPTIIPQRLHRANINNFEEIYNGIISTNNQLNQIYQQIRQRYILENNIQNNQSNAHPNNSRTNTLNLINNNINRIHNFSISNTSTNIYNNLANNNHPHENIYINSFENNHLNHNFNNIREESNIIHNNIFNNIPKYPWLKREKCTNEVINKYGKDSICSICLETFEINNYIHITKCKHLFHYCCIEKAIANNIKDCPICRCNLRDGSKKQIINTDYLNLNHFLSYNINNFQQYNNNNNNYNINSHNIINRNRYASISSYNNNNNRSFFQKICNFMRNLISI
jgi:hypothetical protein